MNIHYAAPFVIAAEAGISADSWGMTAANYGVATAMLAWFMWRDKLDREERKQERIDLQIRHQENITAQKRIEDAFRTNTESILISVSALQTIDSSYKALLDKVRATNKPKPDGL